MAGEAERGTMENLLATPASPLDVMLGKILPYVAIGNVQVGVILLKGNGLVEVWPHLWLLLFHRRGARTRSEPFPPYARLSPALFRRSDQFRTGQRFKLH